MPSLLSNNLLAAINQMESSDSWLFLYDVYLTDTNIAYLVGNNNEAVTFVGTSYDPYPITISDINIDNEGNLPSITASFSNKSLQIQTYLEQFELLDRKVIFRIINTAYLASASDQAAYRFTALNATQSANTISLELGMPNLFARAFPKNRYVRTRCNFLYQGDQCQSFVDEDRSLLGFCDKTLVFCRKVGALEKQMGMPVTHPNRFGGFPSISRRQGVR